MKAFVTRLVIALLGFTIISAPLAASAAQWRAGVGVYGGGVSVRAGYANGWRSGGYWRGGYGWAPGPRYRAWYPGPAYVEGYYGFAPGGFYGYYSHGRWFAHRRWSGGVWFYF